MFNKGPNFLFIGFGGELRKAYATLKRILRYHLYEKRDGAIIDTIKDKNGNIITEEDLVNAKLLTTLKEVQLNILH